MVMFFSGFLLGSAATLAFYHKEALLDARLALETKAGIGLAVAVLAGLMTMLVPTVGLLFSGLQLGGLLAVAALVVVGQFYSLPSLWVPLGGVLASSVAAAVLTLLWQKLFVVVYTSALGAGAVTLCADHLMGTSALPEQVYDMLHQGAPRRLCWFNWAIAGIFPALSLMGALVQWGLTARGLSHGAGGPRESTLSLSPPSTHPPHISNLLLCPLSYPLCRSTPETQKECQKAQLPGVEEEASLAPTAPTSTAQTLQRRRPGSGQCSRFILSSYRFYQKSCIRLWIELSQCYIYQYINIQTQLYTAKVCFL